MSLYRFEKDDIFQNRIKAHPRVHFFINNSTIYYNDEKDAIRSGTETIKQVPHGHLSLYEININRTEGNNDEGLIKPYITKQGTLNSFSTVSTEDFQGFSYGTEISGSYPLSSTISIDYYSSSNAIRRRINSLKNTFNFYKTLSPHYAFESSTWNKGTQDIKLISIPSIFYGSSIKKGSVKLNFYITGSLAATLEDSNRDGELIQTFGPAGAPSTSEIDFNSSFLGFYNDSRIMLEDASGVIKTFLFDSSNTEGATGSIDGSGNVIVQINGFEGSRENIATAFSSAVNLTTSLQISAADDSNGNITLTQDIAGTNGDTTIQNPDFISGITITQFANGASGNNGEVAGVVLYNEGFVSLTGSWNLDNSFTDYYLGKSDSGVPASSPSWLMWGQMSENIFSTDNETKVKSSIYESTSGAFEPPPPNGSFSVSSSWDFECQGTNFIPVTTMLAHAKKGDLNHSNNPTYVEFSDREVSLSEEHDAENKYYEKPDREIASIANSIHPNTQAPFEKTTYISKIGIYDENKNLIAIAKLATPVKKTETREYTFKMKIDF